MRGRFAFWLPGLVAAIVLATAAGVSAGGVVLKPTPAPTPTAVLPTATPLPTDTPVPTDTSLPPPVPTDTPLPPPPPTHTPQPTPVPATDTPQPPPTQPPPTAAPAVVTVVAPTRAAAPTATVVLTPTATATPTPGGAFEGRSVPETPGFGESSSSGTNPAPVFTGVSTWFRALPSWALPAGGAAVAVAFAAWLIARFVHYTGRDLQAKQRMIAESEATRLEERRREVEAVLVSQKDWQRLASQVIADALGRAVQLDPEIPPRVGGKPAPYFTVASRDGTRYTFTTDVAALQAVGLLKKRAKPRRIGSPVEPGLIWRHLAETWLREAGEVVPAVPREAEWFLVVVK
ncbi:MAG: hypothetical protein JW900_11485 [Anaerolineae bacterium]|nr:hypothetical protein [Anaerolineae bacterium]